MTAAAHRAALDHVLTLIAESMWADQLVLRGSMAMAAWVGDAARPPGDLDWVVRRSPVTMLDDLDPCPFFDSLAPVQQWPEAAHGAIRNEIWEFEDFDTGGQRACLPPEGLRWLPTAGQDGFDSFAEAMWDEEFTTLIRRHPHTPEGIAFGDEIEFDRVWDYAEYEPGGENGRVRLRLPWQAPDGTNGEVQVDLAFGETLPELPVCTAIPRSGGRGPVGLWTAGRELSLAWKLHWLAVDQQTQGVSALKDLYDAVLLAELDGLQLSPALRRVALGTEPAGPLAGLLTPASIRRWVISKADLASLRSPADPVNDSPVGPTTGSPAGPASDSPAGSTTDSPAGPASDSPAGPAAGSPAGPASGSLPAASPSAVGSAYPSNIGDPADWLSRLAEAVHRLW
jgi:hypothetical protein